MKCFDPSIYNTEASFELCTQHRFDSVWCFFFSPESKQGRFFPLSAVKKATADFKMSERKREEESDTDNLFRYNTICRQREGEDDEMKDGGMKK